jgi:hypothetical protein
VIAQEPSEVLAVPKGSAAKLFEPEDMVYEMVTIQLGFSVDGMVLRGKCGENACRNKVRCGQGQPDSEPNSPAN